MVVQVPVLKWAYGGCFASWCQTGRYSSPAVVDIDGGLDVALGSYDVVALKGADGTLLWGGPGAAASCAGVARDERIFAGGFDG